MSLGQITPSLSLSHHATCFCRAVGLSLGYGALWEGVMGIALMIAMSSGERRGGTGPSEV